MAGEGRSGGGRRGGSGKMEKSNALWRPWIGTSRKKELRESEHISTMLKTPGESEACLRFIMPFIRLAMKGYVVQ